MTRQTALDSARRSYLILVDRALRRVTGRQRDYVRHLASAWITRLAELDSVGRTDVSLTEHARRRVEFLTRSVNVKLETSDLLRWLDAFPEAMAELLPPSASTFRLKSSHGAVAVAAPVAEPPATDKERQAISARLAA